MNLDFIGNFISGIWDAFNSAFLSILAFFRKIFSVFDFIGDLFEWLLIKLGELLEPVLAVIPDSPLIPLVIFALLGVLFMSLKRPGDDLDRGNIDTCVRLTYA